jgi:hypothetical protein
VLNALIISAVLALMVGAFCLSAVSHYVLLLIREKKRDWEDIQSMEADVSNAPVFDTVYGDIHG